MKPNYRRCVACRKVGHKSEFWRVVRLYPARTVELGDGMGRAAYLCPQETCLQMAQRKDRLGRSLKASVPPSLYDQLWQRLGEEKTVTSSADCGKIVWPKSI